MKSLSDWVNDSELWRTRESDLHLCNRTENLVVFHCQEGRQQSHAQMLGELNHSVQGSRIIPVIPDPGEVISFSSRVMSHCQEVRQQSHARMLGKFKSYCSHSQTLVPVSCTYVASLVPRPL